MNYHTQFSGAFSSSGQWFERSQDLQDTPTGMSWTHLDINHPETKSWLTQALADIDFLIVDALLAEETRPRVTLFGDAVLIILRGVNLNEDAQPEDMVSIRLWITSTRVLSVQRRNLKAVQDILNLGIDGKGPTNTGEFIALLTTRLFERMAPILAELDDRTDQVEETILEKADIHLREQIITVRKQAIIFRRYLAPQRDAIALLANSEFSWIDHRQKRHLFEGHNHITRYVEDLDAIRERAHIVKDELAHLLSDRLNKNMYVLSVIAAIFLPLGFLTGLFGINVSGIPGSDNENAFGVFVIMLLLIASGQYFLFKKMRWL